jgi:hypothetical protein
VRTLGHEVSRRPRADVGLDEVPRAVADRGDRLARVDEVADEADRGGSIRSLSGFTVPPGQQQRVELVGRRVVDQPVHAEGAGVLEVELARQRSRRLDRETWCCAPASVQRLAGCSSSTRSTRRSARIATRRPFSSPAMSRPAMSGCRTTLVQPSSRLSKCW